MSEAEALGDAIGGGVVARAVEPAAGEARGHAATCLNCGAALVGTYCHDCGQAGHVHRTLSSFWHDFLHGVLHFEGKIWRTLPMLAWRPGELTRRYVAGERARFVSPLTLFLFCVFLMFAVLTNLPSGSDSGDFLAGMSEGLTDARDDIRRDIVRQETEIRVRTIERAERAAQGMSTERVDRKLVKARKQLVDLRTAATQIGSVKVTEKEQPTSSWIGARWRQAKQNPQLLAYKLKTNAYKYGWALIPISIPFAWLLFPFNRRYRMYDHAVFVTYSLGFMSILFVATGVLGAMNAPDWVTVTMASVITPVHMYRQLQGAYRLRWYSAALRTVLLTLFAGTSLLLFVLLLVALGVVS